MPLNLRQLHNLTAQTIIEAFKSVEIKNPSFDFTAWIENFSSSDKDRFWQADCIYAKLLKFFHATTVDSAMKTAVAAELLDGEATELEEAHGEALEVIRIFLTFKVHGEGRRPLKNGDSWLHFAVRSRFLPEQLITLLLDHGASMHKVNQSGISAFDLVAVRKDKACLEAILKHPRYQLDESSMDLIFDALKKKYYTALKILFNSHAQYLWQHPYFLNSFCLDSNGDRLIHVAVRTREFKLVRLLLRYGARPDKANDDFDYAMDIAIKDQANVDIIACLLAYSLKCTLSPDTLLSARDIVYALLNINISNDLKEQVCHRLFSGKIDWDFSFTTANNLIELLKTESHMVINDHLTLMEKVGSGVFSSVFKANWRGREVVAKISINRHAEALFVKEVEVLRSLSHENIIKCYGLFERYGHYGMILQYADGGTLSAFIVQNRYYIDTQKCYQFGLQLAKALHYLHTHGWVHLDVKPENILLHDRCRKLILADLGFVAKNGEYFERMRGSVQYMAPELAEDNQFWSANDIFSYAMTMYALATKGDVWPEEMSEQAILHCVLRGVRPSSLRNLAVPSMQTLINLCWQQQPELRPDAGQIIEYLETQAPQTAPAI